MSGLPCLGRRSVAVALENPMMVVQVLELKQRPPQFLYGGERAHPQEILLQDADEPLTVAISLGRPHEAGRTGHAQVGDLPLKVIGQIGGAVVVTNFKPLGDVRLQAGEALGDPLPERVSSPIRRLATVCRQQRLTPLSGPGAALEHPHHRKWITRLAAASSREDRERGRGPGGRGPPGTVPRRAGWRRSPSPIPTAHRVSRGPGWPWGSWG